MPVLVSTYLNYKDFLTGVEDYTGNLLQRKEDVEELIRVVVDCGKEDEFEELIFNAKYICGLMRIVKNSSALPEVGNLNSVRGDLSENIKKAIEQLRQILSCGNKNKSDYFEKFYFTLSAEKLDNLYQLFSDLEAVKKYVNYKKRLL